MSLLEKLSTTAHVSSLHVALLLMRIGRFVRAIVNLQLDVLLLPQIFLGALSADKPDGWRGEMSRHRNVYLELSDRYGAGLLRPRRNTCFYILILATLHGARAWFSCLTLFALGFVTICTKVGVRLRSGRVVLDCCDLCVP